METNKIVVTFSCPKVMESGTENRRVIIQKRGDGASHANVGCTFEVQRTNALGGTFWAPADALGFDLLMAQTINKLWSGLKPTLHTNELTLLDAGALYWNPNAFHLDDLLKQTVINYIFVNNPHRLVFNKNGVFSETLLRDGLGEAAWQPIEKKLATSALITTITAMLADRAIATVDGFSLVIKIGEICGD